MEARVCAGCGNSVSNDSNKCASCGKIYQAPGSSKSEHRSAVATNGGVAVAGDHHGDINVGYSQTAVGSGIAQVQGNGNAVVQVTQGGVNMDVGGNSTVFGSVIGGDSVVTTSLVTVVKYTPSERVFERIRQIRTIIANLPSETYKYELSARFSDLVLTGTQGYPDAAVLICDVLTEKARQYNYAVLHRNLTQLHDELKLRR